MSTFPGRVKLKQPAKINGVNCTGEPAEPLVTRPTSESRFVLDRELQFDAGLNSSAAWTEHLGHDHDQLVKENENDGLSLSDEGSDKTAIPANVGDEQHHINEAIRRTLGPGLPARVLYDFSGDASVQELCLQAGEEIEVLQETMDDVEGWSLARVRQAEEQKREQNVEIKREIDGEENAYEGKVEIGLVPREYYTFITDFISSPTQETSSLQEPNEQQDVSTPRPSTIASRNPPLVPQSTGEWFKQQMRQVSILLSGGRSLNRFSHFVTSGAEAFILRGAPPRPQRPTQSTSKDAPDGLPPTRSDSNRLSTYLPTSLSLASTLGHTREPTAPLPESAPDVHYIDVDEAGLTWREKVPPFEVRVHSPQKHYAVGKEGADGSAYIVYSVTSVFSPPALSSDDDDEDSSKVLSPPAYSITVPRRFSHFLLLHRTLAALLPSFALPPLPQKQFAGRLNSDFVEARRRELERWLRIVVSHPVVRYLDEVRFFLGCEDDVEFRHQLPTILNPRSSSSTKLGRLFFSNVYHPPFQIDLDDPESSETGERFENHLHSVSCGVQHLRNTFGKVREARAGMRNAERALGLEMLALITSRRLLSRDQDDEEDEEEEPVGGQEGNVQSPTVSSPNGHSKKIDRRQKGLQNAEGAWCWREDCSDCLRLTKCMQKTAETLQGVADLFDNHARRTMFETEDSLKDVAHPDAIYAPVLDIHRQTLERFKDASLNATTSSGQQPSSNVNSTDGINGTIAEDEDSVAARCETVLNTTLAEFDAYHAQKVEGFERIVKAHLDGEIAFYEKILSRLRTTRALFDAPSSEVALLMPGARQQSIYERDILSGSVIRSSEPLSHPAPHVLDNKGPRTAMRPVSEAIQGLFEMGFTGVNGVHGSSMEVGEGGGKGRGDAEEGGGGSMFGRLW